MIKVVNCMLCVFWSPFKKSKKEKEDLPKSSRDLFHICCWCECLNWSRCFIGSLNMAVSNSITNSNFLLKLPFLKKETKKNAHLRRKPQPFHHLRGPQNLACSLLTHLSMFPATFLLALSNPDVPAVPQTQPHPHACTSRPLLLEDSFPVPHGLLPPFRSWPRDHLGAGASPG